MNVPGGVAKTITYRRLVDLSHVIDPHIPLWPGDPPVIFKTVADLAEDDYGLRCFLMGEHSATHINAPVSFHKGGAGIDSFPAERLILAAVAIFSVRRVRVVLMSTRAVIFDFGGVLVRTEDPSGRRRWEGHLGLPLGELDRMVFASELTDRSMVGQATEAEIWWSIGAHFGLDGETLEQMRRDFWSGDRLDDQLVQFLRDLRPRYKTAVLSNAWPGARQVFVEYFSLGETVDELIISAEEGLAKPDPRLYHIALQRLGVQPGEAIFVDDTPENVEGARAVGMVGIQFKDPAQAMTDVLSYLGGF
jgi:HAD superfamily hydrolase (TIGR01509 family)